MRRRSVLLTASMAAALVAVGLTLPPAAQASPSGITEFKIPTAASNPRGITPGPDGNMWFVETDANKIGKIGPDGKVVEYKIPIGSSKPLQIVAGSDGAMWFTMSAVNMVGHVTTSGVFKTFTVPTANSTPTGITYDQRSGLVWITEATAGKIASVTNAGVFAEASDFMPANEDPVAITPGQYGRVWFVTKGGNHLDYHYALGSGQSNLEGGAQAVAITSGDDGAMWVADSGTANIARYTAFGASPTLYNQFGTLGGITSGPDRAIWLTSTTGRYIGRITTAGIQTEYMQMTGPAQNTFAPVGISNGPGGTVWFTDPGNNAIGRVFVNDITAATPQPTVLVAYQAVVAKTKVTVNYALTGKAALSLVVKNSKGVSVTVATAAGKTGKGSLVWNRKLKNKAAPKGKYTLSVVASANGKSVKSSLTITLK